MVSSLQGIAVEAEHQLYNYDNYAPLEGAATVCGMRAAPSVEWCGLQIKIDTLMDSCMCILQNLCV